MARIAAGNAYVGIKGRVIALDRRTGEIVWTANLKGLSFVYVQRDGDLILATCSGKVHALDPKTGYIVWTNPLKGMGLGLSSVAGDYGSTSPGVAAAAATEAEKRAAAAGG